MALGGKSLFVDLKTSEAPVADRMVRVSLHHAARTRILRLYVALDLAEQIGLMKPNRGVVQFGFGGAAGIVKVQASPPFADAGYALYHRRGLRFLYIQVARKPDYILPRDFGVMPADYFVDYDEKTIEIDLPKCMLKPASQHLPLLETR